MESTLSDNIRVRFSEAPWSNKIKDVLIAGVGGIGSNLAYVLARMGIPHISLVDPDYVEEANLGAQMFDLIDIGKPKVIAVKRKIKAFSPSTVIYTTTDFIDEDFYISDSYDAIFSCFDNMKARNILFDKWKTSYNYNKVNSEYPYCIYIDARMEAETLQIYAVYDDETIASYEKTLFDDSILEDLPCNFKSTTHTSFITSGLMVAILSNYITNTSLKSNIRAVPFKTEFIVPLIHLL
jgi:molybdopterin/thiamine biosynthesis adenylyltransferase